MVFERARKNDSESKMEEEWFHGREREALVSDKEVRKKS